MDQGALKNKIFRIVSLLYPLFMLVKGCNEHKEPMMEVLKVDYTADNAAEQLAKSIRETGFAIIKITPLIQIL